MNTGDTWSYFRTWRDEELKNGNRLKAMKINRAFENVVKAWAKNNCVSLDRYTIEHILGGNE